MSGSACWAAAAALLAIAASQLLEKKAIVNDTVRDIEDTISALDPDTKAAVVARVTADAARQAKDQSGR